MAWDPATYLRFSDERLRPGFDLLARVGDLPPGPMAELGCGTGVHARAIAERWPDRAFTAIDSSPEMLTQASAARSSIRWVEADLRSWSAPEKLALIFSNAVLQWVDDHEALFPRLMRMLVPGGVLAVQMPRNFDEPSHALMREVAQLGPWAATLKPLLRPEPVAGPEVTYDRLAPLAREGLDIWETVYLHVLSGEDAVLTWMRGTALRPLLTALAGAEREAFERACAERLGRAYPRRADGHTLLPFRRIFIVARAKGN
ncbi:MAG TPA: methyltransferase domain-containing protein [Stellaceae bacterium]|nr:methyltransferase domain-containing protein [Stellaceae bacterium]